MALWNLALDPHGGPVQVPNHGCPGCVGLARIDERSGAVSLTRACYQLGQATAFIARGAQRIATTHVVTYFYPRSGVNVVTPGLDDVAVRNPDGGHVGMEPGVKGPKRLPAASGPENSRPLPRKAGVCETVARCGRRLGHADPSQRGSC